MRYHRHQEADLCSLQRVLSTLEQGCWQRQVDGNGSISLYNRNYTVGRVVAHQKVGVRFAPTSILHEFYCHYLTGRSREPLVFGLLDTGLVRWKCGFEDGVIGQKSRQKTISWQQTIACLPMHRRPLL